MAVVSLAGMSVAGADGARPSNFESVIDSVRPDPGSVQVEIIGGDSFIQVTAEPGTEVSIPGYDGEPYLRIRGDGTVEHNRRSPAVYINQARFGATGPLPGIADSAAAPDWVRIGEGGQVAWHDHRVHWMLSTAPETSDGIVQPWEVPMTVDGVDVVVSGRLLHLPDRFPWPVLVAAAVAATVAWRARRESTRTMLLAGASGVALLSALAWHVSEPPGAEPTVLPIVLPASALAAALVARSTPRVVRHLALPLASVALLVGWFVRRVGVLWMPTVPSPIPTDLERVVSAGVIGVAIGVAIAILLRPYPGVAAAGPGSDQGGSDQGASTCNSSRSQSWTPPRS